MSAIDDAVARIQDIALQMTGIKAAPDYPVDDATNLPLVITHCTGATVTAEDATWCKQLYSINTDIHLPRIHLKRTYELVNTYLPDFAKRLAGDPTLNGKVATIVFPVTVTVSPADWDKVITQMISFQMQVKVVGAPSTSA
jgi:hypothetical protein